MPAKKNRSRPNTNGNGNCISSFLPNLKSDITFAQIKKNPDNNTTDVNRLDHSDGSPGVRKLNGGIAVTPKQQQQLDRNAYLLTLTKDQLKVECRKRGQKTTGTKTELVLSVLHLFF